MVEYANHIGGSINVTPTEKDGTHTWESPCGTRVTISTAGKPLQVKVTNKVGEALLEFTLAVAGDVSTDPEALTSMLQAAWKYITPVLYYEIIGY